jgi:predicted molibdopterin-dependent oxidoreductase YjgC
MMPAAHEGKLKAMYIIGENPLVSDPDLNHADDWVPPAERTDGDFPLYLTTGRVLYQYHTGTMTMKTGGLNEMAPECFVEISPADAKANGVQEGNLATIASRRRSIQARIRISPKAVVGTVFLPFHFAQAAANRLTNDALDPVCGIPEFKVSAVELRAGPRERGPARSSKKNQPSRGHNAMEPVSLGPGASSSSCGFHELCCAAYP